MIQNKDFITRRMMVFNQQSIMLFLVVIFAVSVIADKPLLLDSSKSTKKAVGLDISLMCTFESSGGAANFNLTWLKDGTPFVSKPPRVYMKMLTSYQGILVLNKLHPDDKATYTCRGTNDDGITDADIVLDLYDFAPKIEEMSRVYLRSQQSINITCSSIAVPPATYKWMRKGGVFGSNVIEHKDGVLEIKRLVGILETYTCTATNLAGSDTADVEVQLVQRTTWIEVPTDKNVTAGSSLSYTISFATNSLDPAVVWYKNSFKLPKDLYKETWRREGAKYTSTLVFSDLDTSNTGRYRTMTDLKELSPIEHHATLTVWAKPDISIEEGTEVYFEAGSDVEFTCIVHAYPQAQLQWKKNDTVLVTSNANNTDINDFRMSFSLKLSSVTESGFYTCAGANSQGESEVTVIMNVSPPVVPVDSGTSKSTIIAIVVVSIIVILIIILAAIIYVKFRHRICPNIYRQPNGQFYMDVVEEEKDVSNLNDYEKNPFAIKKNINISIKHTDRTNSIGFRPQETVKGRSLRQTIKGLSMKRPSTGGGPQIENTYARLGTMIVQGRAIDFKSIIFDESLGVGEYGMVNGGRIMDDENATVFKECTIKMLKEDWTPEQRRDMLAELRMMRRISKHRNVILLIGWCVTDENVYVIEELAPFGSLLTYLRAQRCMNQSREALDQLAEEDRVDASTLLSFASQIVSGMQHLEQLQIVHRDIACRNIYLSHEKTCKIADYGLVRDIYSENVYRKTTGGQLPVRWMAKEAIFEGLYSHQSDVWSFGILLWELVNLGKIPYPGIVRTEHLLNELEQGYHMENPGHVSTDIYLLMSHCWNEDPARRPTLNKLERNLNEFISDEEEVHIDLSRMLQSEIDEEQACDDELIKSPTEDFHRPKVHFPSFREEDEEAAGIHNSQGDHNI